MKEEFINIYFNKKQENELVEHVYQVSYHKAIELINDACLLELFANYNNYKSREFYSINAISMCNAILNSEKFFYKIPKNKFSVSVTDKNYKVFQVSADDFCKVILLREKELEEKQLLKQQEKFSFDLDMEDFIINDLALEK